MDLNLYTLEALAGQRLAELRSRAERHDRLRAAAAPRRPVRVRLGLALIRLGTRALAGRGHALAPRLS